MKHYAPYVLDLMEMPSLKLYGSTFQYVSAYFNSH